MTPFANTRIRKRLVEGLARTTFDFAIDVLVVSGLSLLASLLLQPQLATVVRTLDAHAFGWLLQFPIFGVLVAAALRAVQFIGVAWRFLVRAFWFGIYESRAGVAELVEDFARYHLPRPDVAKVIFARISPEDYLLEVAADPDADPEARLFAAVNLGMYMAGRGMPDWRFRRSILTDAIEEFRRSSHHRRPPSTTLGRDNE